MAPYAPQKSGGGAEHEAKKILNEGEIKRAIENALRMIADNLPLEKVAEYSGFSLEKVKELADKK